MTSIEMHEEFRNEDVEAIVKGAIGSTLGDVMYDHSKVNDWSNTIINSALKGLQSLNRPSKYVITVTIMQKNGAGLVVSASMCWDVKRDGLCKVTWENSTALCTVTIFGVSLNLDPVIEIADE
jgi:dynein light chain Tctex-type 1